MKNEVVLKLDGLSCAHCAGKIEDEVKKLEKTEETFLNFMNKEIKIKLKNPKDKTSVLKEVTAIVGKIEPDVKVSEKVDESGAKNSFVLKLNGLNCAHCAGKIEDEVKKLEKADEVYLNFMNKEITIKVKNSKDRSTVTKEATAIVNRIEPEVTVSEKENVEEKEEDEGDFKKAIIRFIIGGLFFAGAIIASKAIGDNQGLLGYVPLGLFIISYLLFGYDVIWSALRNIIKGQIFDEKFLMFIATFGAFFIQEYVEAIAVMLFYQVGEFFQDMAVEKSRKSIKGLMNIMPEEANIFENGVIRTVKPQDVEIGDIVVVKAGEKIPVDGVIIEGNSYIDMSALIGESVPREVFEGTEVLSGAINKNGVIKIKALKKYEGSTVSKILNLVENAGSKKSKTENFITKFARVYTPIVVLSAVVIAVVPTLVMGFDTFPQWLERALVFLVSSCPCALIVSVPLGFFSGIGFASKRGVLIKGSNYLQNLENVETVIFDKTGTITKGVFEVDKVKAYSVSENELIKFAYSVEKLSTHPVAKAISSKYESEIGNEYFDVSDYEEIGGFGIAGKIDGKEILAGNTKLMNRKNISAKEQFSNDTNVLIAYDGKLIGEISVCDTIKDDSIEAVQKLKARGIKTVMLTGDKEKTADAVAQKTGIDLVYANMLPQNKVEKLEEIIAQNKVGKTLFVGDGINDAPVLAMADVGVAMGGVGSDAAIEAADVVIMDDSLSKIDSAIRIAKNTMKIVRENITFVLAVKIIVLILAVFGYAPMWLAVFADVGVALLAVLNSMRKK